MKISTFILCSLSPIFVASAESDVGRQHIRRRLPVGLQSLPCILVEQATQYEHEGKGHRPDFVKEGKKKRGRIFHCELQGADVDYAEAIFVELEGIDADELEAAGVISGVTTLKVEDAEIVPGKLRIPSNSNREYGVAKGRNGGTNHDNTAKGEGANDSIITVRGRELAITGGKKVLVVRIKGTDFSTTADMNALSDAVFGTNGDPVNLKERFNACSNGTLTMEPYKGTTATGVTIDEGVVEVVIDYTIEGADDSAVKNAVYTAATNMLGDLRSQFDHVMFCIPPNTAGGWIAWAYINHWLSVYNDNWCTYPSAQMHEIGHNLGLAHSNEGATNYGDQTGMMGYSYGQDDGPIMCFNNAKNWQLGWYIDRHNTVNAYEGSFSGDLVGVDDYKTSVVNEYVIIKVENGSQDLFIGFNRNTGINSGTREAANQVTIQSYQGSGYSESSLVAKLNQGNTYEVSDYLLSGDKLIIKVVSIGIKASIQIYLELAVTESPTPAPTPVPTPAPSAGPTAAPSAGPTAPTAAPSAGPTAAPSAGPTSAPSPGPTPAPSAGPTAAPSKLPSASPTTSAPTGSPSASPSQMPSATPSKPPSASPTKSLVPSASPSFLPTASPIDCPLKPVGDTCKDGTDCCSGSCTSGGNPSNRVCLASPNNTTPSPISSPTQTPVTSPTPDCFEGTDVEGSCVENADCCSTNVCSGGNPWKNRFCMAN